MSSNKKNNGKGKSAEKLPVDKKELQKIVNKAVSKELQRRMPEPKQVTYESCIRRLNWYFEPHITPKA